MAHLHEDGEEDDDQRGGDEHLARSDGVRLEHLDEREADGAAQTAVRHQELLLHVDRLQSELVGDGRQQEDTCTHKTRETSHRQVPLVPGTQPPLAGRKIGRRPLHQRINSTCLERKRARFVAFQLRKSTRVTSGVFVEFSHTSDALPRSA